MILKQHLMLINEKENIIRVYRTSLAFCAVPSLSVGLRVCGFAGLRVCGFAGLRVCGEPLGILSEVLLKRKSHKGESDKNNHTN